MLKLSFTTSWNAALALASFLDTNIEMYQDRNVLELGAGGALPGIVTAKNGARKVCAFYPVGCRVFKLLILLLKVVLTDYPDESLVDNMRFNVSENVEREDFTRVDVQACLRHERHLCANLNCFRRDIFGDGHRNLYSNPFLYHHPNSI